MRCVRRPIIKGINQMLPFFFCSCVVEPVLRGGLDCLRTVRRAGVEKVAERRVHVAVVGEHASTAAPAIRHPSCQNDPS